jgi:hypothetical protein
MQMTRVVPCAYVLMDNHFCGLAGTPRAKLSAFKQRLLTAFALYARYKQRRPGRLFQGRFKAKLVEDDVYLRAVTRCIHLNPVKIAVGGGRQAKARATERIPQEQLCRLHGGGQEARVRFGALQRPAPKCLSWI